MSRNEAETRSQLIYKAIEKNGWPIHLIGEEQNAGAVYKIGHKARRGRKRVDYLLRLQLTDQSAPFPIAIIEAKKENQHPGQGLEQAQEYARRLNVNFVYSTNGHQFIEYDHFTGHISNPKPMTVFPGPDELRQRYQHHKGINLTSPAAHALTLPYTAQGHGRRYYQDAAIRAVLEKIATGQKRALLHLATGAGKTFIAVHLLKRLMDAGQLDRALFVCDRKELREQAEAAFQNTFGADAQVVTSRNPQTNARILIATYQTLGIESEGDDDQTNASFLIRNYPPNYFSHIIIDECHRSAWGKWSIVLTRNSEAVQVGLTATPRRLTTTISTAHISDPAFAAAVTKATAEEAAITADNINYFGEPVYEYSLSQGTEDGYLALADIAKLEIDIDQTGITQQDILARHPTNAITGQPITAAELAELYEKTSYETRVMLPDRVIAMCADFFQHLLDTGGPHQKTIIYCVRDNHAQAVTRELSNLYHGWCRQNDLHPAHLYAFTCTQSQSGNDQLSDFRGSQSSHYLASTVELLTTGVDVPSTTNIVFFRYLKSAISFAQMVGRGTRITPEKLSFRIYDYTDVTRLFGQDFITKPAPLPTAPPESDGDGEHPDPVIVEVRGFNVQITPVGHYILSEVDGRPTPVPWTTYKQQIADRLRQAAPQPTDFRQNWLDPANRRQLIAQLPDQGSSLYLLQELDNLEDYDTFDVLLQLAYAHTPHTRQARADRFHQTQTAWLQALGPQPANLIRALVRQFAAEGTDALESPDIWHTPSIIRAGRQQAFYKLPNATDVYRQMKERIFVV